MVTVPDSHDCPISDSVGALHDRVSSLEDSVSELAHSITRISTTLDAIAKELDRTNDSLEKLTQIQQNQVNIEATSNARYVELKDGIARAHQRVDKVEPLISKFEHMSANIDQLQEMRRNLVRLNYSVIGLVVAEVLALAFKAV